MSTVRENLSYILGGTAGVSGIALGWFKAAAESKKADADAQMPSVEATKAAFDGLVSTVDALRTEVERLRADRLADQESAANREQILTFEINSLREEVKALRKVLTDHGIPLPNFRVV